MSVIWVNYVLKKPQQSEKHVEARELKLLVLKKKQYRVLKHTVQEEIM